MSIASEITRIQGNISDAYTAANGKGATMPITQNSDNLATTIATIQTGTTPTGTKSITANGVYDVTDFASADVQVPTTAPAHYVEKSVDANGKLINSTNIINLNGVTDVGGGALAYAYYRTNFPANTSVNLSSLTTVSGGNACYYTFEGCTGITSVDLSNLTNISGNTACQYMFNQCTGLTSVDLSGLTTISGSQACQHMFNQCTGLTSVDLSGLTTISGGQACRSMFYGCTGITSVDLSSLTTVSDSACSGMFDACAGITSANLSGLTTISSGNACRYMFSNCTGLTSVDLSGLTTISGSQACQYMFNQCTKLTSIYLPQIKSLDSGTRAQQTALMFYGSGLQICDMRNLESVGDYGILDSMLSTLSYINNINLNSLTHIGKEAARAFLSATNSTIKNSLTDLYFPMLTTFGTNPFHSTAFSGRQGLTIHFRKDAQATVEALANYATLWGAGTGSSAVFDLAGTLTGADSNAYARAEKYSVYASETAGAAKTATAWRYNDTTYYTSGGAEPTVGDTIYSDAACTTAVTTISSIA